MVDEQFQQQLLEVLRSLENLTGCPEWENLCDAALSNDELSLADAAQAVSWAVYYKANPVRIPTLEEVFG